MNDYGIDEDIYIIAKNIHGTFIIPKDSADKSGSVEMVEGRVHEQVTIDLINGIRGDGIVVHAGAFIGDMLPALSGKGKRVFAFEPGHQFFYCAQKVMEINFPTGEHDTTLINKGLSNEPSTLALLFTKGDEENQAQGGCSRIVQHVQEHDLNKVEHVELTTIDAMMPTYHNISVIHLDIEGFEENALKGAINTIRCSKPVLIVELGQTQRMNSPFYTDIIFGELGYEDFGQVCGWNRILKPRDMEWTYTGEIGRESHESFSEI
jgi:FkbM family methyltransferase